VVWDRVDGFLPNEAADLSARYATLDEAMLWCGRHPHCGGFTFGASVEERGGAVLHVAFKRTTEWFPDPQRTWASYIRRLTPCELALHSHRSGLTCCQGACPLEDAELVVECEPAIAMQHGAFPTCSALEAPAAPLDSGGSRSWPPLRVMNIARAGIATMSSQYTGGPVQWTWAGSANDHSTHESSMIHTQCGSSEWWRLELPHDTEVHQVLVTNRPEFGFRLLGFELQLLDARQQVVSGKPFRYAANRTGFVFHPPLRHVRHVRLQSLPNHAQCLHVIEVQVIGRADETQQPEHLASLFEPQRAGGTGAWSWLSDARQGGAGAAATTRSRWWAAALATAAVLGLQVYQVQFYLRAARP
jgi:hypothetical protein